MRYVESEEELLANLDRVARAANEQVERDKRLELGFAVFDTQRGATPKPKSTPFRKNPPKWAHLMDVHELADHLGTNERHVRELIYRRKIPYYKVGGLVRFSADDIEQWLETRRIAPTDETNS
jgi:excisionase family DNA binding protein